MSSQGDSFLKAVRALPGPLVDAMTDGELVDPGLLMTYHLGKNNYRHAWCRFYRFSN